MKAVFVLTSNAFREIVRERTVAIVFFGALILLALSVFLGSLSFDEQRRILVHLGFGSVHIACLAIVLFKGSFLIQREIEKQTVLMVLSRPVTRFQFLVGQYLAICMLLMLQIMIQGALLAGLLGFDVNFERFMLILICIFLEMSVILAFIFLAIQWVRPVVGLLSGLSLYLVGNWLEEMKFFAERSRDESFKVTADVIRWGLPNLFLLNLRSESFLFKGIQTVDYTMVMIHFTFWIGALLFLSGYFFSRRDLV